MVQTLITKYEKGPVTNPKCQNKPYLTYLNEDLARVTKEMNDTLKKYNDTYDDWVSFHLSLRTITHGTTT